MKQVKTQANYIARLIESLPFPLVHRAIGRGENSAIIWEKVEMYRFEGLKYIKFAGAVL